MVGTAARRPLPCARRRTLPDRGPRARLRIALSLLASCLALIVAGCGEGKDQDQTATTAGTMTLTVYSSLPMQGPDRAQSEAVRRGEKLALHEVGGRIGPYTVKYKGLDDASPETGRWDANQTAKNARQAAQDMTAIAYLGEADSGATAFSLPVLNEVGILQVSSGSTLAGLTKPIGAVKGEPDKYYPNGTRTFGRVVPADDVQAAAQLRYQRDSGCTSTYLLNDGEIYGSGLTAQVRAAAERDRYDLAGDERIDPEADDYRALVAQIRSTAADCVLYSGVVQTGTVRLLRELHAGLPRAKLFAGDGLADRAFVRRLGSRLERVVHLTSPALEPSQYPPRSRRFFDEYRRLYRRDAPPSAALGYEAMSVVLQAIKDAGEQGNDRQAVIDAFYEIKDRRSVLGTYSIDKNGDTSLSTYGAYRVRDGQLAFDRALDARASGDGG